MAGSSYSHFIGAVEKHVVSHFALNFTRSVDTCRPARISTNFGKNSISMLKIFHNRKIFSITILRKKNLFFVFVCWSLSLGETLKCASAESRD